MVSSVRALAIEEATIADIHTAYRAGTLTVHAVTAAYLARIAAYDKKGLYINALITVNAKALEEAETLDTAYKASGTFSGPLHGIPVLVKDNLDAVGMPMTSGFQGWKQYYPPTDAPVVAKIKAAGGIILAKAERSLNSKRLAPKSWTRSLSPHSIRYHVRHRPTPNLKPISPRG